MPNEQLKRIKRYEDIMQEAERLLKEDTGDDADTLRDLIAMLEEYYLSDEWKQDFADDEAGLLPKDLKRGVLSEDGIYDLLEEYKGKSLIKSTYPKTGKVSGEYTCVNTRDEWEKRR